MGVIAYVLVKTKPGTSAQIVGSRVIRGVKMADSVFGRYDAILVLSANDLDELNKILYEVIEKHPNVEHTETLVAIPRPIKEEVKPPPKEKITPIAAFHCPSCKALNEVSAAFCSFCGFEFKWT
ncbi:MAG: Lrp/AsnC ligand binding domain-containing protein [Nitrososphaerales archaeon]